MKRGSQTKDDLRDAAKERRVPVSLAQADEEVSFGLVGRIVGAVTHRPIRSAAILVALVASITIVANAVFFQAGPHPAPILATRAIEAKPITTTAVAGTTIPLPRERPDPAEAAARSASLPLSEAQMIGDIQKGLIQLKLFSGTADGKLGPVTKAAILTYQKNAGLPQSGAVSAALLAHVTATAGGATPAMAMAAANAAAAATGERERLKAVQVALNHIGYGKVNVDGVMSAQTVNAIRRFELDNGLPVTGLVGEQLYKKLVDIGAIVPA